MPSKRIGGHKQQSADQVTARIYFEPRLNEAQIGQVAELSVMHGLIDLDYTHGVGNIAAVTVPLESEHALDAFLQQIAAVLDYQLDLAP